MYRYALVFVAMSALLKGGIGIIVSIYPIYIKQFGFDDSGVFAVNLCFYLSFVLLDIPAGRFADRFGYRKSILIGVFLRILGFYLFFSASHWMFFVLGEILIGSGSAFFGSALQAWFINGMKSVGGDHMIPRFYSVEAGISSGFAVMTGIYASLFAQKGYQFMYFSLVCVMIILFAIAFLCVNDVATNFMVTVKFKIKEINKHVDNNFLKVCVVYFLFFVSTQGINLQWQGWAKQNGSNDATIASMFSGMQVLAILSVWFAGWWISASVDKVRSSWHLLIAGMTFLGLMIVCAAILPFHFGIWAIALQSFSRGSGPICADVIVKSSILSDSYRATLTSIVSACKNLGAIVGLVIGGVLTRYCDNHCGWRVSGTMLILGVLVIGLTLLHKNTRSKLC